MPKVMPVLVCIQLRKLVVLVNPALISISHPNADPKLVIPICTKVPFSTK